MRRFPFSKIKIDRAFICGLPEERNAHAIVTAIVGLSRSLDAVTTAEGVENEAQLAAIRALGCTQMQGILFSKPLRDHDLRQLFQVAVARPARSGTKPAPPRFRQRSFGSRRFRP